MKSILAALITLASFQASAISFITEDEVQATLGAQKVIEISKYSVMQKITDEESVCLVGVNSRSARAYVVKKENKSLLVITSSDLSGLKVCGEM